MSHIWMRITHIVSILVFILAINFVVAAPSGLPISSDVIEDTDSLGSILITTLKKSVGQGTKKVMVQFAKKLGLLPGTASSSEAKIVPKIKIDLLALRFEKTQAVEAA